VGDQEGNISLFSLSTLKQTSFFASHLDRITSLQFVSPGVHQTSSSVLINSAPLMLLSTSLDRSVSLWDIQTGQKTPVTTNSPVSAWSSAINPEGTHFALGLDSGELAVYSF